MNLRRRQLRALRGIERDLVGSFPDLDALFQAFARRTYGLDLRWVEDTDRRRPRMFPWRRGRPRTERISDRYAGKWNPHSGEPK